VKFVGDRHLRKEDPRLLTGRGRYVGDITLPGMLHVVLLRSPHAHARIHHVDTARAREHPGVADVVTFGDLGPYDEAGQLQAGSYLDYLLPTATDSKIAHVLLARGANLEARTAWGWTPLETAEKSNTAYMVKLLREHDSKGAV
jgi:xanthine dehydrogenase molybdopterin-binding subunit B